MEREHQDDELHLTPERGETLKIGAVIIPADEEQPLRQNRIGAASLADYQRIVGGNIEPLRLSSPLSSIYFNEEGKLLDLPANRRATLLLWAHNRSFRYGETLVGDAFVVGPLDRAGRDTDVPAELVTMLFEAQRFRCEVQTDGDPNWYTNSRRFDNWTDAYAYVLAVGHRWTRVADVRVVPEE